MSTIRFSGLASGMDTESIVKAMVQPYKNKVDNKKQSQTLLEWKKDAYRAMSTKIDSFFTKQANAARLSSTFNKKTVTSSDPTKVDVSAGAAAPEGTHVINQITKLAEGARINTSTTIVTKSVSADTTASTLGELGLESALEIKVSDGSGTKTITLNPEDTIENIVNTINSSPELEKIQIEFDTTQKKFNITTSGDRQQIKIETTDAGRMEDLEKVGLKISKASKTTKLSEVGISIQGTLKVNDGTKEMEISLKPDMTMGELEAELRQAMPNTSVSFDESVGAFFVSSKKTGASRQITMEVTAGADMDTTLSKLGLSNALGKTISEQGSNAEFTYNGIAMSSETNNATVNGFTVTLKAETTDPITINSVADTEATVTFIKEFVEAYNALITDIQTQLRADSITKYKPLTDEQKKEMTEDDIKLWEEKIKKGLLRNDPSLRAVTDSMRSILAGVVEGNSFKTLSSIGIKTGDWTERGLLHIDEEKLRNAISENADAVTSLFVGGGNPKLAYLEANEDKTSADYDALTGEEKKVWQQKTLGLGDKLYSALQATFKGITDTKSSTSIFNDLLVDAQIKDHKERIEVLEDQLAKKEDNYYKRFVAMEKMMSQLNNQSNWLAQQLGGMSG